MRTLLAAVLFTDRDGRARFREQQVVLDLGTELVQLSAPTSCRAVQLRVSPVGYASDWHCAESPMHLVVLRGQMLFELRDGSTRTFGPGDHLLVDDRLPEGASFDSSVHGHRSRQVGAEELVTLFAWL